MERKQTATTLFLLALAAVSLYYCYVIAKPFLKPIFLAVMFAVVFHPVHGRIQARIRSRSLAAFTTTILVVIIVVIPAIGLGAAVSREITSIYSSVSERSADQGGLNPQVTHTLDRLLGWAGRFVDLSKIDVRGTLVRYVEQITRFLLSWGAQAVGDIVSFLVDILIAFFTLFFLFRDGAWIKNRGAAVLPLDSSQVQRLFTGITNSIVANVYGCLAVGGVQGFLTALAFWFVGLSSPVLWGVVTALFSLIPLIGSAGVWGPAVVILVIGGDWWKGLFLLGWGAVVVAQIDNFVRPYVIGQRAKLHTLVVFFALLGGVKAFGVLGIFIGPVIVAIAAVVLEILVEANRESPPLAIANPEAAASEDR